MLCDKPRKNICGQRPKVVTRSSPIDFNVIVDNVDVNYINEMISFDSPYNLLCSFCDVNIMDSTSFANFSC